MNGPQQVSWYPMVLLAGHLVMAGMATWSLWVLGSGLWVRAGAALLLLVAYGFLWRLRMAPAAQNRFTYRQRLIVHLILEPTVMVLAVLTSIWLPILVGVGLALLGDALASRADSQGLETDRTVREYGEVTNENPLLPLVRAVLHIVEDPGIRRPITELGMVDELTADGEDQLFIRVLLTVPGCPMRTEITKRVTEAVETIEDVKDIHVGLGAMNDE